MDTPSIFSSVIFRPGWCPAISVRSYAVGLSGVLRPGRLGGSFSRLNPPRCRADDSIQFLLARPRACSATEAPDRPECLRDRGKDEFPRDGPLEGPGELGNPPFDPVSGQPVVDHGQDDRLQPERVKLPARNVAIGSTEGTDREPDDLWVFLRGPVLDVVTIREPEIG